MFLLYLMIGALVMTGMNQEFLGHDEVEGQPI
jgi:hypothetical protein